MIDTDATVYTGFNQPADWVGWSVVVRVNSVDIADQLIDKTPVTIEAERNAARVAEFTVKLTGTLDMTAWVGKPVTIDYKTAAGAEWRFFTGVIAVALVDLSDLTLRCQCSDDLQLKADAVDNATLKSLVGGYWHKTTFAETNTGWKYLQDVVATVPVSAELDAAGTLKAHSWLVNATANFTFDAAFIADGELSVELVRRDALINQVTITFDSRFERLYHRSERLHWANPQSFCDNWYYGLKVMYKQMVIDAVAATGWTLTAETYSDAWATGVYNCAVEWGEPVVVWNNWGLGNLVNEFTVDAALRWQQAVTHRFVITLAAPDSVAVYGALPSTTNTSIEHTSAVLDWGGQDTDFTVLPAGFADDGHGNQYRDDIDTADLAAALNCRIAYELETKINASHRSNRCRFRIPVIRDLDFRHTVAVSDGNLTCKGTVAKLRYEFDLSGSRMPTVAVDLAISSGQSGIEAPTQTWSPPSPPSNSGAYQLNYTEVPSYFGNSYNNPEYNEATMWGWFVNRLKPELFGGVPRDPLIPYEKEGLILRYNAISDDYTQNKVQTVAASIDVDVAHNAMVITA